MEWQTEDHVRPCRDAVHSVLDRLQAVGAADAYQAVARAEQQTIAIAVVSLGAERVITFRSQSDKERLERYLLPSGSLLVMSAEMQHDWKHAILADDSASGRISLTFRCLRTA